MTFAQFISTWKRRPSASSFVETVARWLFAFEWIEGDGVVEVQRTASGVQLVFNASQAGLLGSDELVKVNAADGVAGYLADKLGVGTSGAVTLSVSDDGTQLLVDVDLDAIAAAMPADDHKVKANSGDGTPGYLEDKTNSTDGGLAVEDDKLGVVTDKSVTIASNKVQLVGDKAGGDLTSGSFFVYGWDGATRQMYLAEKITVVVGVPQDATTKVTAPVTQEVWVLKAVGTPSSATPSTAPDTVATPVLSPTPPASWSSGTQTVTATCATSGATIRFTTDGSDPTESSTTTSPVLSATTTVKARAFKPGYLPSAVASGVYTYSSIPSADLWLDAAAITGLSDGTPVSSWGRVGSASGGTSPVYKTNIKNGLPVVRFARASSQYQTTGYVPTGELTWYLVLSTDNTYGMVLNRYNDSATGGIATFSHGSGAFYCQAGTGTSWATISMSASNPGWMVCTIRVQASATQMRFNGSQVASAGTGTINPNAGGCILGTDAGASGYLNGDVAEILCYNNAHSDAEVDAVETYLRDKWAV